MQLRGLASILLPVRQIIFWIFKDTGESIPANSGGPSELVTPNLFYLTNFFNYMLGLLQTSVEFDGVQQIELSKDMIYICRTQFSRHFKTLRKTCKPPLWNFCSLLSGQWPLFFYPKEELAIQTSANVNGVASTSLPCPNRALFRRSANKSKVGVWLKLNKSRKGQRRWAVQIPHHTMHIIGRLRWIHVNIQFTNGGYLKLIFLLRWISSFRVIRGRSSVI